VEEPRWNCYVKLMEKQHHQPILDGCYSVAGPRIVVFSILPVMNGAGAERKKHRNQVRSSYPKQTDLKKRRNFRDLGIRLRVH